MRLAFFTDPVLRTPCLDFNFDDPPFDPVAYAEALARLMIESNGIGLSSNQTISSFDVGEVVRFRVFSLASEPNFVCFNPRIVETSGEVLALEEGCLSFPGMVVKVKRSRDARVRFQHPNGETETRLFTGMTARAFQHEMDHLDGVLFFDRIPRLHRDRAYKKWIEHVAVG